MTNIDEDKLLAELEKLKLKHHWKHKKTILKLLYEYTIS